MSASFSQPPSPSRFLLDPFRVSYVANVLGCGGQEQYIARAIERWAAQAIVIKTALFDVSVRIFYGLKQKFLCSCIIIDV